MNYILQSREGNKLRCVSLVETKDDLNETIYRGILRTKDFDQNLVIYREKLKLFFLSIPFHLMHFF